LAQPSIAACCTANSLPVSARPVPAVYAVPTLSTAHSHAVFPALRLRIEPAAQGAGAAIFAKVTEPSTSIAVPMLPAWSFCT
jgi:hypothetical protein